MKETPEEKKRIQNFLPGELSKDGFLGNDNRHIHDIIREDFKTLRSYHLTQQDAADILQNILNKGKKGLEGDVRIGVLQTRVQWDRGMLPCPFGHKKLYPKIVVTIQRPDSSILMRYSQLSIHMIREHGFFGGKGSVFRIDPELVQTLKKEMKMTIS